MRLNMITGRIKRTVALAMTAAMLLTQTALPSAAELDAAAKTDTVSSDRADTQAGAFTENEPEEMKTEELSGLDLMQSEGYLDESEIDCDVCNEEFPESSGDGVIEPGNSTEDEVPVGDDADFEGEGGKDAELNYDPAAIVSALNGAENDNTVFYAAPYVKNTVTGIKLKWKIKGAKFFSLDSFKVDGSYETIVVRTKKKSFIDTTAFDSTNNIHIYRVKAFDKTGSEMGEYMTIPSSTILSADTGVDYDTAQIVFAKLGHHYSYTVERASKKKFADVQDSFVVFADDEGTVSGDSASGAYSRATTGVTRLLASLSVTDNAAALVDTKKNFYRVTSHLEVEGLDVSGKVSPAVQVKNNSYPAPTLVRISRYYGQGDEDVTDHDLCFKSGNFYVRVDWNFKGKIAEDEAQIAIYRAGSNGKYKRITSEFVSDLTTVSENNAEGKKTGNLLYAVPYNNFPPGKTFDYKAAIIHKKKVGAMSAPLERTCTFGKVQVVSAGEHAYDEVKLTWLSDPCAKKYNIYRSLDAWDSLTSAQEAMDTYDKDRFKKIASKKNDTPREGTEMSFLDKKGLEVGMYHIYRIVPVNGKEADFKNSNKAMAIKAYPASPEKVFVYPVNLHEMDIVWSDASDAVLYKIQRTNKISGGEPVFADEKGVDFREWECDKSGKLEGRIKYSKVGESSAITDDFGKDCKGYNYVSVKLDNTDTGVELGKKYYYRVVAACKIKGGAIMWADAESAKWTEAHLQLARVRDMNTTLYSSKSTADGSNVAHIEFKSSGKTKATSIDNQYDYERVDHYDVVYATSEKGLDTNSPLVIDGKTFTYTTTAGQQSIDIISKPDTALYKNYRGIKRGKLYYFGVRTVYKNGDNYIYGNWTKRKFILPVEIFFYPEGSDKNEISSPQKRYEMESAAVKKFIIDFDPYDTTYTALSKGYPKVGLVAANGDGGSAFTITYNADDVDNNGMHFFKVTAPTVATTTTTTTTSTVTQPKSTMEIIAYNVGATGDVDKQLRKRYYLSARKPSSSSDNGK
ncbi:MAG: hypothetical protein IKR68_08955 [Lachnospiraceae bacterium]|nr:hypothetical protein [Lachnospiraceae bacterium]